MKKIGLIGGMSWESSLEYYRLLNLGVKKALGGFHSCHCIMESVDFAEIELLQHQDQWSALGELLVKAAQNLEKAGAEGIILCTNTMHILAGPIEENTSIPFLHIAKATGERIQKMQKNKVLLLGTRFTMEKYFYKSVLKKNYNIDVIVPDLSDRIQIHDIIYSELVQGILRNESREKFKEIIEKQMSFGAEGVILGCTEIPLLIKQSDIEIPVFDTTRIHVDQAVEFVLS